ncbi:MAG: hypothetical protein ACHP84_06145 [Caulobacterales bacterium]
MDVQGVTPVLPVPDVAEAARIWAALLGAAPTFVDGERWAQFDVAGMRIALAGTDRVSDQAGIMIKVGDVAAAREAAHAAGLHAGEIQEGPHELRCVVTAPGGWPVVLYAAKAR